MRNTVRCAWADKDPLMSAYAFMQAVGMVNDHLTSCFRFRQLGGSTR